MKCINAAVDIRGAAAGGNMQTEIKTKGLQWKN